MACHTLLHAHINANEYNETVHIHKSLVMLVIQQSRTTFVINVKISLLCVCVHSEEKSSFKMRRKLRFNVEGMGVAYKELRYAVRNAWVTVRYRQE